MRVGTRGCLAALALLIGACGGGDDEPAAAGPTADDVIAAFRQAGLSVPNPRDNTAQNCSSLKCEKLITTDSYSVHQWPSEAAADTWASSSMVMTTLVEGTVTVRFITGGSAKEVDPEPYRAALVAME